MSFAKFAASEMQTFPGMHAEQVMPARGGHQHSSMVLRIRFYGWEQPGLVKVTLKAT